MSTAFETGESGTLLIKTEPVPNGIRIKVQDQGIPHDPHPGQEQPTGYLPRELMDEYAFRNLGPDGKETTLIKYHKAPPHDTPPASVELPKLPEQAPDAEKITIRWMKQEEALDVCKCVYDAYGYSYAGEFIYYPERVAALNQSGMMRSAVAVDEDNTIVGHFALIFDAFAPPEMGVAVIRKRYRGLGLARRLGEFLEAEAIALKLPGVHAKQVTAHDWSQRFCQRIGFKDCAFLFAHTPASTSFKGIADQLSGRHPCVACYKYLSPPKPETYYLPGNHADIIKRLATNLSLQADFVDAPENTALPDGRSEMEVTVHPRRNLAVIHITQYGADLLPMLKQRLHRLRSQDIRITESYLALRHVATPMVSELMEGLGFFFTGIMPGTKLGLSLVMQTLDGLDIDFSADAINTPIARELLAHISQNRVL